MNFVNDDLKITPRAHLSSESNYNSNLSEHLCQFRKECKLFTDIYIKTEALIHSTADDLFKAAQALLNATRSSKDEAHKLLRAAATLGHKKARSILAWYQLVGTQVSSTNSGSRSAPDPAGAHQIFKQLAEFGVPSAHAVKTQ